MTIVEIRDEILSLKDIVELCIFSLSQQEKEENNVKVSNILHFHVLRQIEMIDQNLSDLQDSWHEL